MDDWFARAWGLTGDELRYTLDPADVHGPNFPGETFQALKEKELAKFGEYRTRRLVLEAWGAFVLVVRGLDCFWGRGSFPRARNGLKAGLQAVRSAGFSLFFGTSGILAGLGAA